MKKINIAIDGPAGSGKSTTAKRVADKLNYLHVDTGALYRAVALAWLRSGKELNEENMKEILHKINIRQEPAGMEAKTILDGEDVSEEIRKPEVTEWSSPISAMPVVRESLLGIQRHLASNGGVVMDGRDIGTVVLPNAELKIFIVASVEKRAERRTKEFKEKGIEADFEEVKQQLIKRDKQDSEREIAPLKKADDAIEIDTSDCLIDDQCNKVLKFAWKYINDNYVDGK